MLLAVECFFHPLPLIISCFSVEVIRTVSTEEVPCPAALI